MIHTNKQLTPDAIIGIDCAVIIMTKKAKSKRASKKGTRMKLILASTAPGTDLKPNFAPRLISFWHIMDKQVEAHKEWPKIINFMEGKDEN